MAAPRPKPTFEWPSGEIALPRGFLTPNALACAPTLHWPTGHLSEPLRQELYPPTPCVTHSGLTRTCRMCYIKANELQDKANKRLINADQKLKVVFGGKSQVSMFEMTKLVSVHLH